VAFGHTLAWKACAGCGLVDVGCSVVECSCVPVAIVCEFCCILLVLVTLDPRYLRVSIKS
jgi:hypothetical protein